MFFFANSAMSNKQDITCFDVWGTLIQVMNYKIYNLLRLTNTRFGTLTWLKTFKCLRLFKSVLLGGQHMLNGTVIPISGLKLLRPVCKNFTGQALLTDVTISFLFDLIHQRCTLSFTV